jgi:hypothetical protein
LKPAAGLLVRCSRKKERAVLAWRAYTGEERSREERSKRGRALHRRQREASAANNGVRLELDGDGASARIGGQVRERCGKGARGARAQLL